MRRGLAVLSLAALAATRTHASEVAVHAELPAWEESRSIVTERTAFASPEVQFDRIDAAAEGYGWDHGSWTSVSVFPPFTVLGIGELTVPDGGDTALHWTGATATALWGGVTIASAGWALSTLVLGGSFTASPTLTMGATNLGISLDPPKAVAASLGNGTWFAAAGVFQGSGGLSFPTDWHVGRFLMAGMFAGITGPGFGLFYAQLQGETSVRADAGLFSLIFGSYFSAEGSLLLRSGVGWWTGDWNRPAWGIGLLAAGVMVWSTSSSLQTLRTWHEMVGFFRFEDRSEQIAYTLDFNPAWALIIRPRVYLKPAPSCRIELYRWIPLVGGWNWSRNPPVPAGPAAAPGPVIPASVATMLLTGMGIGLEAQL